MILKDESVGNHSEAVSSDSFRELKIFGHDGHSLGMNGTEIGIFKEGNQVCFSSFLKGKNSLALESDFLFELGRDLTDQSLEGKLSDEQVSLNEGRKGKESSTMMVES